MSITFGADPVDEAVRAALARLASHERVVERQRVDLKEEAGRRGRAGEILPGSPQNEAAARALAAECACMANTPGGGALILGVADDSTLVGTELDEEWLRARIFELTRRRLTVDARPAFVDDVRLLVLRMVEAVEPVRWKDKITWRVADRCVEIDASTWHARRSTGLLVDWSAQPSALSADAARPEAVEVVRGFLRESVDPGANELAETTTPDLLRRLNSVTGDGYLTNAAALLLVGREAPSLDYIRRETAGGDSTERVRRGGRPLVVELQEVFSAARANNPLLHLGSGLSVGQTRRIPPRALREAIVNSVAHREWAVPDPSVVEHVGYSLRVTSPGGFFGGVTAGNIINHPSRSRNTALTDLLAAIRVAEREGVGVDRMIADMLRFGYPLPDIREETSPSVVVTLVADAVDVGWMTWLSRFEDSRSTTDLRWLMAVHRLVLDGWFDVRRLADYLQVAEIEAQMVVRELYVAKVAGAPLISRVDGVPTATPDAWALTPGARAALAAADAEGATRRRWPGREDIAASYARARGRISSTELGSLVGSAPSNVGAVLRGLEEEGVLEPSRTNRRGAGFYYRLAADQA